MRPGKPRSFLDPRRRNGVNIVCLVFLVVGLFLGIGAVGTGIAAVSTMTGPSAQGHVVGNDGGQARVEYEVNGQRYVTTSSVSTDPPPRVGDTRTVYYDAEQPGDGTIGGFLLWFVPVFLGGMALVFGGVGGGLVYVQSRGPQP